MQRYEALQVRPFKFVPVGSGLAKMMAIVDGSFDKFS
jgi:hypothetical protein